MLILSLMEVTNLAKASASGSEKGLGPAKVSLQGLLEAPLFTIQLESKLRLASVPIQLLAGTGWRVLRHIRS